MKFSYGLGGTFTANISSNIFLDSMETHLIPPVRTLLQKLIPKGSRDGENWAINVVGYCTGNIRFLDELKKIVNEDHQVCTLVCSLVSWPDVFCSDNTVRDRNTIFAWKLVSRYGRKRHVNNNILYF